MIGLERRAADLTRKIEEQRAWIRRCGGSREGYRLRYGVPGVTDPDEVLGDGGDAIWAADQAELRRLLAERGELEARLDRARRRVRA
jgi:hypothetical protein